MFQNINRNDLHVNNQTIKEHFFNKNKSIGRGKFFKKCRDDMYAACWYVIKNMLDNSYGSIFFSYN